MTDVEVSTGKPVSPKLQAAREEVYRRREARKNRIADLERQVEEWSSAKAAQNEIRLAALEKTRQLQGRIDVAVSEITALRQVKDVIPKDE